MPPIPPKVDPTASSLAKLNPKQKQFIEVSASANEQKQAKSALEMYEEAIRSDAGSRISAPRIGPSRLEEREIDPIVAYEKSLQSGVTSTYKPAPRTVTGIREVRAATDAARDVVSPLVASEVVFGKGNQEPSGVEGIVYDVFNKFDLDPGKGDFYIGENIFQSRPGKFFLGDAEKGKLGVLGTVDKYTWKSLWSALKEVNDAIPRDRYGIVEDLISRAIFGFTQNVRIDKGDASFDDFFKQINDPEFGPGKAFPLRSNETFGIPKWGNLDLWVDRLVAGGQTIGTDPMTLVSGVGGGAKTLAAKSAAEAALYGTSKVGKIVALHSEKLLAREAAELSVRQLTKEVDDLARLAAREVTNPVLAGELAVKQASLNAAKSAVINLEKDLKGVVTEIGTKAPKRVAGPKARQVEAADVLDIYQGAKETVETGNILRNAVPEELAAAQKVIAAPAAASADEIANAVELINTGRVIVRKATPAEIALAERTVKFVNPALAKDIVAKGLTAYSQAKHAQAAIIRGYSQGIRYANLFTIPGSKYITKWLGQAVGNIRVNAFLSPLGRTNVLELVGKPGVDDLLGKAGRLKLRTYLSTGKIRVPGTAKFRSITAEEAADFISILTADSMATAAKSFYGTQIGSKFAPSVKAIDDIDVPIVTRALDVPSGKTVSKMLPAERAAFSDYTKQIDETYNATNKAIKAVGGRPLSRPTSYFPRAQSREFITWATSHAEDIQVIAKNLGVEPEQLIHGFIENKLVKGANFFGHSLTDADLLGGVKRLNEILKEQGYKFKFYTENFTEATARFVAKHARMQAHIFALEQWMDRGSDVLTRAKITTREGIKSELTPLTNLERRIGSVLTPDVLATMSYPKIQSIVDDLKYVREVVSDDIVYTNQVDELILAIDEKVAQIDRLVKNGTLPPVSLDVVGAEADNLAIAMADEISGIRTNIFESSEEAWRSLAPMISDGVEAIFEKMPNVGVATRNDINDMVRNVVTMTQSGPIRRGFGTFAEKLYQVQKGSMLSLPGTIIRNIQGGLVVMAAFGARPGNANFGFDMLRSWKRAAANGIDFDSWVEDFARSVNKSESVLVKDNFVQNIKEAFVYSGASSGEISDLAKGFGGRPIGIFGLEAKGIGREGTVLKNVTKKVSEIGGKIPIISGPGNVLPLAAVRKYGALAEEYMRFAMTWDGIQQGLSGPLAGARTSRALLDYSDLSKLDEKGRAFFPFWNFMVYNAPTQYMNMLVNPGVYNAYNRFRNATEDKEGTSPFLPQSWKERGAYKLIIGDNFYASWDLAIPGTGQAWWSMSVPELFSSANPTMRGLLDAYVYQRNSYTQKQIYDPSDPTPKSIQQFAYAARATLPNLNVVARELLVIGNLLPGDSAQKKLIDLNNNKIIKAVFGTREITEEEMLKVVQFNALLSYLGIPIRELSSDQEIAELWRRYYTDLEPLIKQKRNKP